VEESPTFPSGVQAGTLRRSGRYVDFGPIGQLDRDALALGDDMWYPTSCGRHEFPFSIPAYDTGFDSSAERGSIPSCRLPACKRLARAVPLAGQRTATRGGLTRVEWTAFIERTRPRRDTNMIARPPVPAEPVVYCVRRRFTLGNLLAFTFVFAALFGLLRFTNAWSPLYVISGIFFFAVAAAQMFVPKAPRMASMAIGATAGLVFAITMLAVDPMRTQLFFIIIVLSVSAVFLLLGALAGYVAGGVLAGVFLVGDAVDRLFAPREHSSKAAPREADPEAEPADPKSLEN
jgi:hypothetical protein